MQNNTKTEVLQRYSPTPAILSPSNQPNTQEVSPSSSPDTLNPYGASTKQIYAAYIKTAGEGNKPKADLLHQMYNDEVAYQKSKGISQ